MNSELNKAVIFVIVVGILLNVGIWLLAEGIAAGVKWLLG